MSPATSIPTANPDWPFALGIPRASGRLRSCPEDFEVEEIPAITPSGEGTHAWLWVEKNSANTDWVAGQLARHFGCPARDVGYAGMKDRHAVTRQWFSIPAPADGLPPSLDPEIPGVKILQAVLNGKKLRRGILKGNRFRIVLRELEGDPADLELRLQKISKSGVPNYFGQQRFGMDGGNVERAVHWLLHGGRLPRNKRSIYLSSVRSYLFNQVLAERLRQKNWNRMLPGELAMLDGTHSIFGCDLIDEELENRCSQFDIHPTGPLPGRGGMQPTADVMAIEQAVLAPCQGWIASLERQGVDASRRSLRLKPADLAWTWQGSDLLLEFSLPAGAYATVVIRELIHEKAA